MQPSGYTGLRTVRLVLKLVSEVKETHCSNISLQPQFGTAALASEGFCQIGGVGSVNNARLGKTAFGQARIYEAVLG